MGKDLWIRIESDMCCSIHRVSEVRAVFDRDFSKSFCSDNMLYHIFGKVRDKKVSRDMTRGLNLSKAFYENYLEGMEMQEHYYKKWKPLHND